MSSLTNNSAAILVAATLFSTPNPARAATSLERLAVRAPFVKQAVVRSATTFRFVPFPTPIDSQVGNFVFSANGTAYFTAYQNEVVSFTASGLLTQLAVPNAFVSSSLLYARGRLWMFAYPRGVVSVLPDGSGRRLYQFESANVSVAVRQMTYGPDGNIYILASADDPQNGTNQTYPLLRIDSHGVVTTVTNLPVAPLNDFGGATSMVFGTDGLLYFGYSDPATGAFGIAQLGSSGSLTRFPIGEVSSLVASRGNIYFFGSGNGLGRLTPTGAVTYTAFPVTGNVYPSMLSVDKGGNLWDNLTSASGTALYQFNVYTGHFNGPYDTGSGYISLNAPVVSPSDSIWTFAALSSSSNIPAGFGVFSR